jgi:DNA-binding LytR/AlgR family response regulator
MRVLLLEDERPALDLLDRCVRVAPGVEVVGRATSVWEARAWAAANPPPNLILSDIQLSDGLVFDALEAFPVPVPVVFVTAYDRFVLQAFEHHAVDYVLKPIDAARIVAAIDRYRSLRAAVAPELAAIEQAVASRLEGRRGAEVVPVEVASIRWARVEGGATVVVDRDGRRRRVEGTLGELEAALESAGFFRLNRQYLAARDGVAGFRSIGHGRLVVRLEPASEDAVVVAQARAPAFRAWMAVVGVRAGRTGA